MVFNVLVWILTFLWLCVIFYFSSQPSEESDEQTSFVIKILNDVFGTDVTQGETVEKFGVLQSIDFFVRKTAHLTEYAVLGALSFLSFRELSCKFERKRLFQMSSCLLFCLLYAASDEFHQLFVPGRAAMVRDVLIDFCGSTIGVGVCLIIALIYDKIRNSQLASECGVRNLE